MVNGHGLPVTSIEIQKRLRTVNGAGDAYNPWSGEAGNTLPIGAWDDVASSLQGRFSDKIESNEVDTLQKWSRMDTLEDGNTDRIVRQYRLTVTSAAGHQFYYTEAMREQDFRRLWGDYTPLYGETDPWGNLSTKSHYLIADENDIVIRRFLKFDPEVYNQ